MVLVADMSAFADRTTALGPTEELVVLNQFFVKLIVSSLRHSSGIVDKFVGDEIRVVFSEEFGSEDPFQEAIHVARWMAERDPWQFCPRIGIARGTITVGYVGVPLRPDCTVFGRPITLATRCASVDPPDSARVSITFPAELWCSRNFDDMFPETPLWVGDTQTTRPHTWKLLPTKTTRLKGVGEIELCYIANTSVVIPPGSIEDAIRELCRELRRRGKYRPIGTHDGD